MSLSSLQVLENNRNALLLAEVVAWLHDYRKCSEEHLKTQVRNKSLQAQAIPRDTLVQKYPDLQSVLITLQGVSRSFSDLLNDRTWSNYWLGQFQSRCHHTAHFDKQEPDDGSQDYPDTQISSPFAYERNIPSGLTQKLWKLPWAKITSSYSATNRSEVLREISKLFSQTAADTRRPNNEVDLWSWGLLVGALYKASLAGTLLTGQVPVANDLHWRLLAVRVDGLEFISNVARIPDLLARRELITNALDSVRELIEVTYPLGTEIYRDENGSLYIVPDIANLLQLIDSKGRVLWELIQKEFAQNAGGEILPQIELEEKSWWGQDPDWASKSKQGIPTQDELPDIVGFLSQTIIAPPDKQEVEKWWQGSQGEELCPVCRLRPIKEGAEVCDTCLQRRKSRIQWWKDNPQQTIWIDEIADHNGRLALIVGKFGLDDWLSGDLVQTMLVKADQNNPGGCVPKNPSPARLRRVWETCQRFWRETVGEILQRHSYGDGSPLRCVRVALVPDDTSGWQENVPYDGTVNGKAVSLLWRKRERRFITISNVESGVSQAHDETGLVGEWQNRACTVDLPYRPGQQKMFKIQQVMLLSGDPIHTYIPYLTLLESPDQFLTLVPAAEALEIAQKIEQEYRRQMGKVQNRLPLFLGLVFSPRKLPLTAVMDAARRMLEQVKIDEDDWDVECVSPSLDGQNLYLRLSRGSERLEFNVSLKMGDQKTEDVWYPYFFVKTFFDRTPDNRAHRFQLNGRWLVHTKNLKPGDKVTITPSRFAYLFLESTAGRFRFDPQRDALLLDYLNRLQDLWQAICKSPNMTDTKLQAISALLERKRQEWVLPFPTPQNPIADETFRRLVETTLKRDNVKVRVEEVLNGHFQRTVDLHLHILKCRVKDFQKEAQDDQPNA